MEGLVIKRHLHHLCLFSSNHWDIHSECYKSSSASHHVAFIRKQRSTRIEVRGTVWL